MTTARTPEPEPDSAGGVSGAVALFAVLSWLLGREIVNPDTGILATTLTGAACLIVPAVILAAIVLSAASHRPARRRHSHGRRHYR